MDWAWLRISEKRKVLHVRLIELYISAKFQTCTYNTYRFTEDQRKFRKNAFFRP